MLPLVSLFPSYVLKTFFRRIVRLVESGSLSFARHSMLGRKTCQSMCSHLLSVRDPNVLQIRPVPVRLRAQTITKGLAGTCGPGRWEKT